MKASRTTYNMKGIVNFENCPFDIMPDITSIVFRAMPSPCARHDNSPECSSSLAPSLFLAIHCSSKGRCIRRRRLLSQSSCLLRATRYQFGTEWKLACCVQNEEPMCQRSIVSSRLLMSCAVTLVLDIKPRYNPLTMR